MNKVELLELLAKYLTKNDYDKAEKLLEDLIDEAVTETRRDLGYS